MASLEAGKCIVKRKLIENFFYIVDKDSNDVLLKFKKGQEKVYNKIKWCRENGKQPLIIILKARQLGMSTFTEALGCAFAITERNQDMLIMSHRADTTDNLFNMTHNYIAKLPTELKPDILKDNENEFFFNNKERTGLNSKIKVMTANKKNEDGVGRGHTFTFVHMSEYDFWDCDAPKVLMGIMSACTNSAIVIIESTANGCRYLKQMWDEAISLGDRSIWIPMFFPWFQEDEYEADYSPIDFQNLDDEEKELIELFKQDEDTCNLPYERYLRKLQWRRNKIGAMSGKVEYFHQEFPSTPQEAFITSGDSVFNTSLIASRKRMLSRQPTPFEDRGYYEYELGFNPETQTRFFKSWKWISDHKNGYITKFKKPIDRVPYIVSTDPSGSGSDNTASEVIDNRTCEQVCELHKGKLTALQIAIQTMCLGFDYNIAYLTSETNYAPEVVSFYKEFGYPNLIVDENKTGLGVQVLKKYGFRTTTANRGNLITNLEEIIGSRGCDEDHCQLHLINSMTLLTEAENFVKVAKYDDEGHIKQIKAQANAGAHDDTLMAYAIAIEVRKTGQQSFTLLPENKEEKQKDPFDILLGLDDEISYFEDEEDAMIYD